MVPYWLMFLAFAVCAAQERVRPAHWTPSPRSRIVGLSWLFAAAALVLFIGFRFEVGGDWYNYNRMLNETNNKDLSDLLSIYDPGYILLNWVSGLLGYGIIGVNLVCAIIFSSALISFCKRLPLPWLAMSISFPYLILVVAMGYTRQGVAVGFELLGLSALGSGSVVWFVIWIVAGATFHKSAVLLLPLAAMLPYKNRFLSISFATIATLLAFRALLQSDAENLVKNYVEAEYQSQGAFIRSLMNIVPAVVFLLFGKRFRFNPVNQRIVYIFSVFSVPAFILSFVSSATTAVDRTALYLIPLQLIVFSNMPIALSDVIAPTTQRLLILIYYALVLTIWLNFAANANYWVPYKTYLVDLQ